MGSNEEITEKEFDKKMSIIFERILDEKERETEEIFGEMIEEIIRTKGEYIDGPENFNMFISHSLDDSLDLFLDKTGVGLELKPEIRHKLYFLYKSYSFMENNIRNIIIKREKSSCCADKSRFILRSYERFLKTEKMPDMNIGDSYWIPHFGEGKEWMEFCDSLIELYYGNPDNYVMNLGKLLKTPEDSFIKNIIDEYMLDNSCNTFNLHELADSVQGATLVDIENYLNKMIGKKFEIKMIDICPYCRTELENISKDKERDYCKKCDDDVPNHYVMSYYSKI